VGVNLKYTTEAVKARKRKTSSAPPTPKKSFENEAVCFKPPHVPIKVDGEERLLSISEFFGKTKGEKESYVEECDVIIAFLDGLEARQSREEAALYLMDILPKFGTAEPFVEMVKAANSISEFNYGETASLKFLERISHFADGSWRGETLTDVMRAYNSKPIVESFELFSKITEKTMNKAAAQIVRMGFMLREGHVIEKIGEVITDLSRRFGFYVTIDYRHILRGIGKNDKIPDENKAKLIHEISEYLLKAKDEEDIEMFASNILTHLRSSRVEEPEQTILEICEKYRKFYCG